MLTPYLPEHTLKTLHQLTKRKQSKRVYEMHPGTLEQNNGSAPVCLLRI